MPGTSPGRARWFAAGALAVVLLGAAAGALLLRGGISARTEPSALESRIARTARSWAIPSSARAARNPVPPGPSADHCAVCHANDGSGETPMGRNLYPRAPDMRRAETQDLSDGELFYIIENGVRLTGMPGWGGEGSAEGSWRLVHFIRHLPRLTAEEKERMESLNPRSPEEWRRREDEDAFLRGEEPAAQTSGHGSHSHGRSGR